MPAEPEKPEPPATPEVPAEPEKPEPSAASEVPATTEVPVTPAAPKVSAATRRPQIQTTSDLAAPATNRSLYIVECKTPKDLCSALYNDWISRLEFPNQSKRIFTFKKEYRWLGNEILFLGRE